ncbi:MAG TPA: histidine phosphatase family protein [Rhizomicrobium sp.]|nr:histidine phosphatase family protein [Rhizomicrobium sp.]
MGPSPVLYLVRHGECVHNVERRIAGQSDSPLTALGRRQASENGRLLKVLVGDLANLDYVSSPLHRAAASMELLRAAAGLSPEGYRADRRLMEMDFGEDTGKTYAEIDRGVGRFGAQNWDFVRPGGESLGMLNARVGRFLESLRRDAVVVSHAGPLRLIRAYLLGLSRTEALAYHPPNAGIVRLSKGAEAVLGG